MKWNGKCRETAESKSESDIEILFALQMKHISNFIHEIDFVDGSHFL